MNISFGKRIPLSQHKVYDKREQKFTNATLYEIDGKDEDDIYYIALQKGNWGDLRRCITTDMASKRKKLSSGCELSTYDEITLPNNKFYSLENEKGDSIGLLEMTGAYNIRDVRYFQANPDRNYRYAGQIMLAEVAKEIADETNAELTVSDPSDEGRKFYINVCGFQPKSKDSHKLYMNQDGIKNFIENVERRTEASNIDLMA